MHHMPIDTSQPADTVARKFLDNADHSGPGEAAEKYALTSIGFALLAIHSELVKANATQDVPRRRFFRAQWRLGGGQ